MEIKIKIWMVEGENGGLSRGDGDSVLGGFCGPFFMWWSLWNREKGGVFCWDFLLSWSVPCMDFIGVLGRFWRKEKRGKCCFGRFMQGRRE